MVDQYVDKLLLLGKITINTCSCMVPDMLERSRATKLCYLKNLEMTGGILWQGEFKNCWMCSQATFHTSLLQPGDRRSMTVPMSLDGPITYILIQVKLQLGGKLLLMEGGMSGSLYLLCLVLGLGTDVFYRACVPILHWAKPM